MICEWILKGGPNQGKNCTAKVMPGATYCNRHKKMAVKDAPVAKSKEISVEVDEPSLPQLEFYESDVAPDGVSEPPQVNEDGHEDIQESEEAPEPPPRLDLKTKITEKIPAGFDSIAYLPEPEDIEDIDEDSETLPPSEDGDESPREEVPTRSREEVNLEIERDNLENFKAEVELRTLLKSYPEVHDLVPSDILERDVPIQTKLTLVKEILNDQRGFVFAFSGLTAVTSLAEGIAVSKGYDISGLGDRVKSDREVKRLLRLIAIKHEDKLNEMEPETALALCIMGLGGEQYAKNKEIKARNALENVNPNDFVRDTRERRTPPWAS